MNTVPFFSRRNQVYPVIWQGRATVEKHFADQSDWRREKELYALLAGKLPLPTVLRAEPGLLVLEYKNSPTLLSELERQEETGFDPAPWQGLAAWLRRCHGLCGQLPTEGNLRNFLWDGAKCHVIGLDLEGYRSDSLERCGARLMAALLSYDPAGTDIKQQAAGVLGLELGVADKLLSEARQALSAHRRGRQHKPLSGIVLAGGKSRRMGQDKAGLVLGGKTLLQRQVDKLRALGIEDIMLSGAGCPALPGVRVIPDELPGNGPLGGLHACLRCAKEDACLVLSVDAPLIPAAALAHLHQCHTGGVTVLRHGTIEEPLIGVYDRAVSNQIAALLNAGERSVRALKGAVRWQGFHYLGPEELLTNCNTPEEFAAAKRIAEDCACR